MYKHLVVAVDGSNTSLNALQHASSLAVAGNAQLTLVTVANPSEYMTLAPEFLQHESYEAAAISGGQQKCLPKPALPPKTQALPTCKHTCWSHRAAKKKWRKNWSILPTHRAQI